LKIKSVRFFRATRIILVIFLILSVILILPNSIQKLTIASKMRHNEITSFDSMNLVKAKVNLEKEIARLDKQISRKTPKSHYLIINSASNEFFLYKGNELVHKDKCSTGSYILLKNGEEQQWMFKTPKGEFHVRSKTTSPVWKKPDWAYIEEGLPVPPENHYSRFEYGVLGDYALNLGHGYLIHGTLYQRFLGLPVTHGCIRLNDKNLELVYNSLSLGSKVYIY